jgi:hypothetical protein
MCVCVCVCVCVCSKLYFKTINCDYEGISKEDWQTCPYMEAKG